MRAGQVLAVLAGCALVLAGCRSGAGADPSPSPVPTYECTAPGSCTPQQAAKEQAAAKAHREAEAALKAGMAELYRIAAQGGAIRATDELKRYYTGEELDSAVAAMKKFKSQGRVGHGAVKIARVEFRTAYPQQAQQLWVCEDGTGFYTTDTSGKHRTSPGVHLVYTVTMTLEHGAWKQSASTDAQKVKSCAG